MRRHLINDKNSGFTLLEALVSLTILAVAVTGASTVARYGFIHVSKTRDIQLANYYASSHLNSLEQEANLTIGLTHGYYSEHFKWSLNLSELNEHEQLGDVKAIRANLTIHFGASNYHFHSLILRKSNSIQKRTQLSSRPFGSIEGE